MKLAPFVIGLIGITLIGARASAAPEAADSDTAVTVAAAAGAATADEPERSRITERPKGESTSEKVLRFPLRVALLPLWVLDRTAEGLLFAVDDRKLVPRTEHVVEKLTSRGLFLKIGGAGDGAGFGGGVTWRTRRSGVVPVFSTSASIRAYEDHRFSLAFLRVLPADLRASITARYRSRPEEDFFGVGPGTRSADRSTYDLEETIASVRVVKATDIGGGGSLRVDGRLGYTKANVFEGRDPAFPSAGALFTEETAPGLAEGAEVVDADVWMTFDFRDAPDYPTSGIAVRLGAGISGDVESQGPGATEFGWTRWGAEIQGHLPLLGRGNRFGPRSVVSVRLRGDFTDERGDREIPFFRLPRMGGSDSLRGLREYRFRDRNRVIANLEYRWRIQSLLEAVLFLDEGQVFRNRDELDFGELESSWGGGIRGVLGQSTLFRLEIGDSDEGTRIFFKFAKMFAVT